MRISDWSSDVCSSDLGHRSTVEHDLDAVVLKRLGVEAVQPGDFGQHVVAQYRPVELGLADLPAKPTGVLKVFGEMRAVNQQLLGHAAANDARAADLMRSEEHTSELQSLMRISYAV